MTFVSPLLVVAALVSFAFAHHSAYGDSDFLSVSCPYFSSVSLTAVFLTEEIKLLLPLRPVLSVLPMAGTGTLASNAVFLNHPDPPERTCNDGWTWDNSGLKCLPSLAPIPTPTHGNEDCVENEFL